ncbi:uncharacterized protein BT62DRAFT_920683 [Guyanagaster necrorhizus]|uniref:Uncharacterized protein n=1 Tax=Guyanagaster necrorhizus TaxID=856835 RepID=A0A9P8AT34_9AGAR|nr:uncharacterized protein BT62DRAFT_920683 [Guyanagaster necrorhizus MCA 3950]KAG7445477.1 hypothetical protein BT62DRAFT_920683 [Guyanagaster necrorhizus MCA 3950]
MEIRRGNSKAGNHIYNSGFPFLKVKGEATAGKMWEKVKDEFENTLKMMTVNLCWKLQSIHEDLITIRADSGDENFVAILLGSLLTSYDPYLAALTATSALLNKPPHPDTYLHGIRDEADRHALKTRTKEVKEVTFSVNANSSKGGRKGKGKKSNVECYNSHKKGHGGGKEGQGPKLKGKGKAIANTAADSDDNGVWAAMYNLESKEDDCKWLEMAEQNVAEHLDAESSRGVENSPLEGLKVKYVDEEIAWLTDDEDISLSEIEGSKSDAEIDHSLPNCFPMKSILKVTMDQCQTLSSLLKPEIRVRVVPFCYQAKDDDGPVTALARWLPLPSIPPPNAGLV